MEDHKIHFWTPYHDAGNGLGTDCKKYQSAKASKHDIEAKDMKF